MQSSSTLLSKYNIQNGEMKIYCLRIVMWVVFLGALPAISKNTIVAGSRAAVGSALLRFFCVAKSRPHKKNQARRIPGASPVC